MKKYLMILLFVLVMVLAVGCDNSSYKFKKDYESINGLTNKNGKVHRTVSIDKDNPFVEVEAKDIVEKIKNKESFYVYFGSKLCPWCRSVIEKAIEVAKTNNIDTIYYVDIWDDEGNEILRDKYTLDENSKLVLSIEPNESYTELLTLLETFLSDYTLKDSNGKEVMVGEKRIYAPNFFYIDNGVVSKMTEGISPIQKDSREELTYEMLKDEERLFKEFFASNVCTEQGC